eukprot:GHVR01027182.1.p1 GENE.GHVR01027182.1~~GHVR01027182.1.p1  ORF type:complete len:414 (-),score=-0.61 GHVR01027182.1:14-1255(-)
MHILYMHSENSNILRNIKIISQVSSWRAQQALIVLCEAMMSFLALFMLRHEMSEIDVLLVFCTIFLACGMVIKAHRTRMLTNPNIIPILVASTASVSSVCAVFGLYPGPALGISAMCLLCLKDLTTSSAVGDVHHAALKSKIPPMQLVTTGMLIGALLMIVFLFGSGRLLDGAPVAWLALISAASLTVLGAMMRKKIRIKPPVRLTHIPRRVRSICQLSMAYNATSFVGRRFILPLAIASMAVDLGFGQQAYAFVGTVLSILVLLGLASRTLSNLDLDPLRMMFAGYFSGLVLWVVLALLIAAPTTIFTACIALLSVFVIEITAKIWTLGFIETLRVESRKQGERKATSELSYFNYFMEVKSYGAALGFATAILAIYFGLTPLIPMAIIGIIFGAIVAALLQRNMILPAPRIM